MKIFVANLPFHIREIDLNQLFGLFGSVSNTKIITENGRSKGFGFLEMEDDQRASMAISQPDGSEIGDRKIVVHAADSQNTTSTTHKRPRVSFPKF